MAAKVKFVLNLAGEHSIGVLRNVVDAVSGSFAAVKFVNLSTLRWTASQNGGYSQKEQPQ